MKLPPRFRLIWPVLACGLVYPRAMFAETAPSWAPCRSISAPTPARKSKGIYVSRFDPATGQLTPPELAAATPSPSFLALHPGGRFLYAAGENTSLGGKPVGAVSAFSLRREDGPAHPAEPAIFRRRGTLSPGRGPDGEMPPRRQLWQRQHRRPPDPGGWHAGRARHGHSAPGLQRQPGAPGRAARPFHHPRPRGPVRPHLRSRPGPGARLSPRRSQGARSRRTTRPSRRSSPARDHATSRFIHRAALSS